MQIKPKQQTKKIPKLRFPEFGGEWEEKRLGEIAKFRRGSFPQPYGLSKWYDDENGLPFIQVYDVGFDGRLKETTKRKITPEAAKLSVFAEKGTVVLTIQGSIGRIAITQYDAYIDRTLLIFTSYLLPVNKEFFMYSVYLLFEEEKRKAPGGTIKTITKEKLTNFKIKLPSLPEQQKIASFLSVVDERIKILQTKREALVKYKKGIMQKIFPAKDRQVPEIRFKPARNATHSVAGGNDNGKDFPEWEEKRLGEIAKIYQPKTISTSQLDKNADYVVYGANGIIGRYKDYNHEYEQIIVTCRGSTCGTVTFTKPKSWITGNAMVINVDDSEEIVKSFLFYQLQNDNLKYLITGSGQPQITGDIRLHKIKIPSLPEQQKIANFLSAIDKKIELFDAQIQKMQEWKRGLMQGLFV